MNLKSKIKKEMNPWYYKGRKFKDELIPETAVGFVYQMIATIDGKAVCYIGKKNFYSNRKKKLGKKELAKITDKRKKKYIMTKTLSYKNYYSSNTELKKIAKNGGRISRRILRICFSKTELTYYETKYQFKFEVLEKDNYLNGNILGRFYKGKI